MTRSRSVSRSVSRSPERDDDRKSRSASRSRSRSRSRDSRTPPVRGHRTRSRSRSRSPRDRRSSRSSRSPLFSKKPPRGVGDRTAAVWHKEKKRLQRDAPDPSRCLGIFNLSMYTTEKDLREMFTEFGEIEKIDLIYDHPTGRSRGFGFIYFERLDDATAARDKLNGIELDGRKIRIDYSVTKRAHSPTPGNYQGFLPSGSRGGGGGGAPSRGYGGGRGGGGRGYGGDRGGDRDRYDRGGGYGDRGGYDRDRGYGGGGRSSRRSPSPRYSRRSRSRSYERDRYY